MEYNLAPKIERKQFLQDTTPITKIAAESKKNTHIEEIEEGVREFVDDAKKNSKLYSTKCIHN